VGEIFRFGRVIVRIWSNDHFPPHVEVFWPSMRKPEAQAKFYLSNLKCFEFEGFSFRDIRRIQTELRKRHDKLWQAWRNIHGEEKD
jgi:hypothetical protein